MLEANAELIWNHATKTERTWLLGPLSGVVLGSEREKAASLSRQNWRGLPDDVRKQLLGNPWFEQGTSAVLRRELMKE